MIISYSEKLEPTEGRRLRLPRNQLSFIIFPNIEQDTVNNKGNLTPEGQEGYMKNEEKVVGREVGSDVESPAEESEEILLEVTNSAAGGSSFIDFFLFVQDKG
ncbi:hypothetical protein DL95DRAFT_137252 [Leptodontidium sp. 2 PMI_412]|nr:hypothetical protein DL95DRAFT_137252 [Leptodontidium sp. 2 PMI_412]